MSKGIVLTEDNNTRGLIRRWIMFMYEKNNGTNVDCIFFRGSFVLKSYKPHCCKLAPWQPITEKNAATCGLHGKQMMGELPARERRYYLIGQLCQTMWGRGSLIISLLAVGQVGKKLLTCFQTFAHCQEANGKSCNQQPATLLPPYHEEHEW